MPHKDAEARRKYARAWKARNPDKVRAYQSALVVRLKAAGSSMWKRYGRHRDESMRKREERYGAGVCDAIEAWDRKCGICGKDLPAKFTVDHDHETGRFRGLLCYSCNVGLGLFKDDAGLLQAAIDYLNVAREKVA